MDLIPREFFSNDLFDDFMDMKPKKHPDMKCDIYEENGTYHLEMDLPGVKKEDVKIHEEDGYLTVTVSKNEENSKEGKNYIRKERYSGMYQRRFYVGDISENDVKAEFKDSVLKVSFPDSKKELKRRNIQID